MDECIVLHVSSSDDKSLVDLSGVEKFRYLPTAKISYEVRSIRPRFSYVSFFVSKLLDCYLEKSR